MFYESDSEHLKPSVQKMKEMEEIFRKQLEKRLSFRTDLRVFEEFFVEFPDKTVFLLLYAVLIYNFSVTTSHI